MFRNRKASHKPDEELICKFRKAFSDVISTPSISNNAPLNQTSVDPGRPVVDHEDMKANDPTPRALQDFRFTPSFMDPNSFAFTSLANQPPGYYTPSSGGMGTLFHSQAGDLHTPTMGSNMITLSLSHHLPSVSPNAHGAPALGLDHFSPQYMQQPFNTLSPFAQQTSYAPSTFLHRDSGYDPMDGSVDESSLNDVDMQGTSTSHFASSTRDFADAMDFQGFEGAKFRYNVTLRAPTAMIKHATEIPVTYLNKGQAYSLFVVDSTPPPIGAQLVRYRTYVRVSFEDEEQRSKPAACWQLWKEGRGSNEAHQRGGKLLAVEFVDPIQGGDNDQKHRHIQLEQASFDGFCVTWTANSATGTSDCAISVRFNFLSTDFSHSKGVKGIPVRLCAKTEIISPESTDASTGKNMEVCYCKVKLFRDHGAERKLSNDVAHVKKAIEKLKQQIAQAEMGGGNFGKRKRSSGSIAMKGGDNRPVKIPKHKRTWSMDSQNEGAEKLSAEDDLHMKLATMQDMFSSTRSVSVLNLLGDEQDDPDLFPVHLPGESNDYIKFEPISRQNTLDFRPSIDETSVSSILSPTNTSASINSPRRPSDRHLSGAQYDSGYSESVDASRDQSSMSRTGSEHLGEKLLLNYPIKIQKSPVGNSDMSTGYIEAIDIDPTYRPPAEHPPKPIACFYVRFPAKEAHQSEYYRAVYLTERTVRDFLRKISEKQKIDPERIVRILHINQNGLKVVVDDDVVRELPDGQDMVAEFSDASMLDGTADVVPSAVEVKLTY